MNDELDEILEESIEIIEEDEIDDEIEEELEEEADDDDDETDTDVDDAEVDEFEDNLNASSEAMIEVSEMAEEPAGSPTGEAEEVVVTEGRDFILRVATPGNDIITGAPSDDILIGRTGSDRLLGVNPGVGNPGQGEIDILIGGPSQPVEMFEGQGTTVAPDNNTFHLGDANNAYYTGEGLNDFALLLDFNPSKDTIILNGSSDDYTLSEVNIGSETINAIFQGDSDELVALALPGTSGLTLDDESFEYIDTPPSPDPSLSSAEQLGTAAIDLSWGTAIDSAGNTYVVGGTSGDLAGSNTGANDAWIAKFDPEGNEIFRQQFGTPLPETAFNVAVDSNDNVFVSGITSGSLGGENAGGIGNDIWLAKFDSQGNQQFIQQFGTPEPVDNAFWGTLEVDGEDNVLLTGYTEGNLGGENAGTADIWLAKFDNDGNQQFIEQFGTPEPDESFGVATDAENNVLVTGWTLGNLEGENAGLFDGWVAKYDSQGNQLWLDQFGTSDYDFAWDVDADSAGNVYTTGYTLGSLEGSNAGAYDAFVAKYSPEGDQIWVQQLGTSGSEESLEIDVDSNDDLLITGFTDGDFGGTNSGGDDVWTAKLDSDGNTIYIQQFGSSEFDRELGLDSNDSKIVQSGFTDGSLGGTNAGSYDAWLAELSLDDLSLL